MNLVERWFSALTTKKLERSSHNSVKELAADITNWVKDWNENPIPFVWHKTADEILDRLARYCNQINPTQQTRQPLCQHTSGTRPYRQRSTFFNLFSWFSWPPRRPPANMDLCQRVGTELSSSCSGAISIL